MPLPFVSGVHRTVGKDRVLGARCLAGAWGCSWNSRLKSQWRSRIRFEDKVGGQRGKDLELEVLRSIRAGLPLRAEGRSGEVEGGGEVRRESGGLGRPGRLAALNHPRSSDELLRGCCWPVTAPGPAQSGKHASAETWAGSTAPGPGAAPEQRPPLSLSFGASQPPPGQPRHLRTPNHCPHPTLPPWAALPVHLPRVEAIRQEPQGLKPLACPPSRRHVSQKETLARWQGARGSERGCDGAGGRATLALPHPLPSSSVPRNKNV